MVKRNTGRRGRRAGGLLALLASLATAPMASAEVVSNHSGLICKNFNGGEANDIFYTTGGIGARSTTARQIICPLVRRTLNTNGAIIFVDVNHTGSQSTFCLATSYNAFGQLASSSRTFTGSGVGSVVLNLAGPGKSAFNSDYSVFCAIPGASKGQVTGVHLFEQ